MSRLDKLQGIVDDQLHDTHMSDALKERVRQGVREAKPTKRPFYTRKGLMGGLAAAAACLLIFFILLPRGGQDLPAPVQMTTTTPTAGNTAAAKTVAVRAQSETAGGIAVSTAFIIETGDAGLTSDALQAGLTISPAVNYTLTAQGDGAFVLTPEQTLSKATVYQISMAGLAAPEDAGADSPRVWAFQTESEMSLVATLPANDASWVPVDTGIEMTFSRSVGDVTGFVSITPETPGRFECYDKTVVFVPNQPLRPDTLYTVSIKAGLTAATGEVLNEAQAFSFRTVLTDALSSTSYRISGPITESFLPRDPVVVELRNDSYYGSQDPIPVAVQVYPLSGEDYIALATEHRAALHPTLGRSSDYLFKTDGREALMGFDSEIVIPDYRGFVVLPENPGAGYYLVDIRPQDSGALSYEAIQKLVCVSDLAVYAQSQNGDALVWLNDAATGLPLADAAASVSGAAAKTDALGVALVAVPDTEAPVPLHITAADGREWRDILSLEPEAAPTAGALYQACLYFDRAAYLPTDTIRYWGVVRARDGSAALPEGVTLSIASLPDQTVTLSETGAFSGEITFKNQLSTYTTAILKVGDDHLVYANLQITEYTKPAYVLDIDADKPYFRQSESLGFTVSASFFDGTPAIGLQLEGNGQSLTTNAQGTARFVSQGPSGWRWGWEPQTYYLSLYTSGQEDATVYTNTWVPYFHTDYMQRLEVVEVDGGWQLQAETNAIDFAALDTWLMDHPDNFFGKDFASAIAGAPYSQSMSVEVRRVQTVRTEDGTVYDFINKVNRPRYSYDSVETVIDRFTLATGAGGMGLSKLIPYQNTYETAYYLDITMETPDGQSFAYSMNLGTPVWYNAYAANTKFYYFRAPEGTDFTVGDTFTVPLAEQNSTVEGGRLLYAVNRDGLISWQMADGLTATVDCGAEHIPGFVLSAAYFDGTHIFPVSPLWCYFDSSSRQLELDITSDKQSYAPGETATVQVTVTGAGSAPVEADLLLSVVDEAAFAVAEQHINILGDFYTARMSAPSTHASYVQHDMAGNGFAEGGGEGEADGFRHEFIDTAAFITARTGADGKATLTFHVPDNLTSWRLTAAAVSDTAWAGMGRSNVITTLPFFVNVVRSAQYIQGDTIVLSARGAGASITSGDRVVYHATVSGAGLSEALSDTVTASEYAYFNFGKLPLGQYTLELTAQCGQLRDAVRHTFEVVDSRLEVPVLTLTDLPGIDQIESARYPVSVTLLDPSLSQWLSTAYDLASSSGQRIDHRLARSTADALLAAADPGYIASAADASAVQQWDGGVAALSYGQSDPSLTAYAAAACPDALNLDAARQYLYGILYSRASAPQSIASAYMGLAALGEPVLLDLRSLLGSRDELSWNLPLATGLALLGDTSAARTWYDAAISPILNRPDDQIACLDAPSAATGETAYTRAELTAQAAALAAVLGHADAQPLLHYLGRMRLVDAAPLPAALALKAMPRTSGETATVTYQLDGAVVTANLTAATPLHTVRMNEAQLKEAAFTLASGQATAAVGRMGGVAEALQIPLPAERASIIKDYHAPPGGRVTVRITVTIPTGLDAATDDLYKGYYSVTDVLPSGLRFISVPYGTGGWYLEREENGRLTFGMNTRYWRDNVEKHQNRFDIVYYARVALPGEYVSESAVLAHPATGGAMVTTRGAFTTTP